MLERYFYLQFTQKITFTSFGIYFWSTCWKASLQVTYSLCPLIPSDPSHFLRRVHTTSLWSTSNTYFGFFQCHQDLHCLQAEGCWHRWKKKTEIPKGIIANTFWWIKGNTPKWVFYFLFWAAGRADASTDAAGVSNANLITQLVEALKLKRVLTFKDK